MIVISFYLSIDRERKIESRIRFLYFFRSEEIEKKNKIKFEDRNAQFHNLFAIFKITIFIWYFTRKKGLSVLVIFTLTDTNTAVCEEG